MTRAIATRAVEAMTCELDVNRFHAFAKQTIQSLRPVREMRTTTGKYVQSIIL
jgi:hypothetical protein